jgi:RNA polymerase sigma-70 factor (ECF subfamily)
MIPAGDSVLPVRERAEAELVRAIRAGDMDAFGELYRRFSPMLMSVAYRLLRSKEASEDVLHDVFVGLPEAMRKYNEQGRLGAWLKQVTARVALSVLRHEETIARHGQAGPSVIDRDPHTKMTLDSAVASLPVSLRTVLVLKEIEGFSHAEIAGMLGISKGASEVRLHRALVALRDTVMRGERAS